MQKEEPSGHLWLLSAINPPLLCARLVGKHTRHTQKPLEFFSAGTGDDTRWQAEAGLCVSKRSGASPSISNRSSSEMKKQ